MYLVLILTYVLLAVLGTGIFTWIRRKKITKERIGKARKRAERGGEMIPKPALSSAEDGMITEKGESIS